jgi:hypothetical protein
MQSESRFDRSLWTIALALAAALVIVNFAQRPLFGGDGEASGFGSPLTLWVTGGEAESQTRLVARQVAACWNLGVGGRQASVGVLSGSTASALVDFLQHTHPTPDELLLVTSTTLADVAHDERAAPGSEARELAQRAASLLDEAPVVRVIGSDALTLAVRDSSRLHDTGQLTALMRTRPAQPLIGISQNNWLQGNLAALVQSAEVDGQLPFDSYNSSRLALAALMSGEVEVVLARRSGVASDLAAGHVRTLAWPVGAGSPRSTVELLAPRGLDPNRLTMLRKQSAELCPGSTWRRLMHTDGLTSSRATTSPASDFLRKNLLEATNLQELAARIVRDY